MLKKVKPQRITEKIVEQIKDNIGHGDFAAGDKLPSEREMAEQMGVSRSSIREAIQILEHTGFLEVIQGRGTFIKEIGRESLTDPLQLLLMSSESSYRDVYEFRLAIEIWAAGKAAERITDEQATDLKNIVSCMQQNIEQGLPITELDAQFHLAIAKASRNSVYYHISNTVFHMISEVTRQSHEYLFLSSEDKKILLDDHGAICDSIVSHNSDQARLLMQKHLGRVERIFTNNSDNVRS